MALRLNLSHKLVLRSLSLTRKSLVPIQTGTKLLKIPTKVQIIQPQFASFSTSSYLRSSSKNDDDGDDDPKKTLEDLTEGETAKLDGAPGTTTIVDIPAALGGGPGGPGVPMTPQIPDHWPIVPVIAINKHPVFPKFIKIVEVTDEKLMAILRRKVRLNQPYAGVFVKKNDEDSSEVVKDLEHLYPIGSFVQIVEMQDLGNKLRMVVMAHRRISLQEQVVGEVTEEGTTEQNTDEDPSVLMANTDNYEHEPYETTDEVKALTQEIIKTIRDIIVSVQCSSRKFHKLLCLKFVKLRLQRFV